MNFQSLKTRFYACKEQKNHYPCLEINYTKPNFENMCGGGGWIEVFG